MKHVTFALYAFISFFLLQFLSLHAISTPSTRRRASTLEFFKQFQGLQKGDTLKGVHALKKHLQSLGYYDRFHLHDHDHDDHYDENLESAIKTYQINFNLKPTGVIDFKTMATMSMPRCGTPDVVKGTTGMRSGYNLSTGSNNFHTHYAFFPGTPKWPSDKKTITYAFLDPDTTQDVKEAVRNAFIRWSGFSPFSYQYIPESEYNTADIKISFQKGDHGDGFPFDGPLNVLLAHAFAPPDGRFHMDAEEKWTFGAVPGAVDLQTIALHELGHTLGLAHTSVEAAIMYPILPIGGIKDMNDDDIQGITALYGGIKK